MAKKKAPQRLAGAEESCISPEQEAIIQWFRTVKFRKNLLGGVDEAAMWKKLEELYALYEAAIRAERTRYNVLLEQLIKQAREDVISRRMYPDNYTDEQIEVDLKKFESVIVNLAVYDRSQAGEAFMSNYTENGTQRSWRDRDSLLAGVFPFIKVL